MSFFNQVWKKNQDLFEQIKSMDFLQKMIDGTLSNQQFFYYIEQDIHYLCDYIRASSYLTARSENFEQLSFFLEIAQSGLSEINRIHKHYQNMPEYQEQGTYTPAYLNYKNFILHYTASKDIAIAYASISACPVLYFFVAQELSQNSQLKDKYRFWFKENSNQIVKEFIEKMIYWFDHFASKFPQYQSAMHNVFREALFLEYHFWQDAYELKKQSKI